MKLRVLRYLFAYLCILLSINQETSHPLGETSVLECPSSSSSRISRELYPEECENYRAEDKVVEVRVVTEAYTKATNAVGSTWLTKDMTNFDIKRFLHINDNNGNKAAKALIAHSKWRTEPHGSVDVMSRASEFEKSPLNKEIFWMGQNAQGCPTLVVRSNFHDGKNYDDDPKKYSDFFVYQIEKGRKLYGLGAQHRGCVVVDRFAVNPEIANVEMSFDMRFIPGLMATFRHLTHILNTNYPNCIESIYIVPSTWFSQACWKILKNIVDRETREKFHFIGAEEVAGRMAKHFPPSRLPSYLGGTSETYGGNCFFCSAPQIPGRHGVYPVGGLGSDEPGGGSGLFPGLRRSWAQAKVPTISATQLEQYLSVEI
jgi:hypothetical protein